MGTGTGSKGIEYKTLKITIPEWNNLINQIISGRFANKI
jgi:hypothetical protein